MNIQSFCSTVGELLADCSPRYSRYMSDFKKRPDSKYFSFPEIFEGLIAHPLRAIGQNAVLTIDALDECDNEADGHKTLLDTLARFSMPHLRILITDLPERDIKVWATTHEGYANFSQVEGESEDVKLYITDRLQNLSSNVRRRISNVITRAEGLFIWARIACDLLEKSLDPEMILTAMEGQGSLDLDYLYATVLGQSAPKDMASHPVVILVLQMIVAARRLLAISDLEQLVPMPEIIEPIVTCLGSFLVFKDREDPIRLLHITFREFITSRGRAGAYFVQTQFGHYNLALESMNRIRQFLGQVGFQPAPFERRSRKERGHTFDAKLLIGYTESGHMRQASGLTIVHYPAES